MQILIDSLRFLFPRMPRPGRGRALGRTLIVLALVLPQMAGAAPAALWYAAPAKDWYEALPIGNGRLGAMVFGRPSDELLQLNEQTLWTGGPAAPNPNPDAPKYLQPVRDALFRDDVGAAVGLLKKMQGPNTQMYQPLGDLLIKQHFGGAVVNYRRELDIGNAIATTAFEADGVRFERSVFASAPDQLIVVNLTSSKPGALDFDLSNGHELAFRREVNVAPNAPAELVFRAKARIGSDERRDPKPLVFTDDAVCNGMRYEWRTRIIENDGRVHALADGLAVRGASKVTLAISAATSFSGIGNCPDKDGRNESAAVDAYYAAAAGLGHAELLRRHVADYKKYFDRVELALAGPAAPEAPIDERLKRYKAGRPDTGLEQLYFQFGRYLLISSSRPGGFPANLQGIWNHLIRPSWRSNYTTNINLQMNYWPAEMTNLAEMTEPLIAHIGRMAANGTVTAKNYYGMRGWAVHHNSDLWAQTNPVGEGRGDPKWANWSLGSPWLSQHLYEHYRFSGDKRYLRDVAYPLMKGAADFCLDWLTERDGALVTAPSTSPENVYLHPTGFKAAVTVASAMDMEIIWDLFTNLIEASKALGTDRDYAAMLEKKRAMLSPLRIGRKGNLVEWYGDWEDADPQHRHVSHLFALHPGRQISPLLNAPYAAAARKTLELRGDGGTGWSKAWKINFWARLLDGDHAHKVYQELLRESTLNNLFDTHPPFQIDGNFGATSGIAEMLLQSQLNEVHLLPALPSAWAAGGKVRGLVARGAFEVGMVWSKGRLVSATLSSRMGNRVVLRSSEKIRVAGMRVKSTSVGADGRAYYLTSFATVKGKTYRLSVP
ncbi:MAG: glycoside hydrolase family 95 protein [Pseudomonadota bacterium]